MGTKGTDTDHDALCMKLNQENVTEKLARYRSGPCEPEFSLIHRARITNQAADALCQLAPTRTGNTPLEGDIPEMTVTTLKMNDTTDTEDNSDNKQIGLTNVDWNDEALQLEVTGGILFMAEGHKDEPRREELQILDQFIAEHATQKNCIEASKTVRNTNSQHQFDRHGILV